MFPLRDRTRRWICRTIFLTVGVAPTLSIIGWCMAMASPSHIASLREQFAAAVGRGLALRETHSSPAQRHAARRSRVVRSRNQRIAGAHRATGNARRRPSNVDRLGRRNQRGPNRLAVAAHRTSPATGRGSARRFAACDLGRCIGPLAGRFAIIRRQRISIQRPRQGPKSGGHGSACKCFCSHTDRNSCRSFARRRPACPAPPSNFAPSMHRCRAACSPRWRRSKIILGAVHLAGNDESGRKSNRLARRVPGTTS